MLFDLGSDMDRFDIFKIGETGSLAPVQELADRLVVCHPGVLVPNRDGEEFEKSLSRFWPDIGDDRWNLEWITPKVDALPKNVMASNKRTVQGVPWSWRNCGKIDLRQPRLVHRSRRQGT
jgi:hypothetical protein